MSEVGEFLAAKNTKFAKAYGSRNPKLENLKLTKGKTFYSPWQKSTVEKRSRVLLQGTAVTYAILRIWL